MIDKLSVIPTVCSLLRVSRPPTIFWGVTKAVVNSFKRMVFGRSTPHVLKESLKRVAPFVAYSYTSTTVIRIVCSLWAVTAVAHVYPRKVLRRTRLAFSSRFAVRHICRVANWSFFIRLISCTAAAFSCSSPPQKSRLYGNRVTTITLAKPHSSAICVPPRWPQRNQFARP